MNKKHLVFMIENDKQKQRREKQLENIQKKYQQEIDKLNSKTH